MIFLYLRIEFSSWNEPLASDASKYFSDSIMACLLHIYSRCAREIKDSEKGIQGSHIEIQDVGKRDKV